MQVKHERWKKTNERNEMKMKIKNTKLLSGNEMKSKKYEREGRWIETDFMWKWNKDNQAGSKSGAKKILN